MTTTRCDSLSLAWISNLPHRRGGGGSYAVNHGASTALEAHFAVDRRPPIPIRANRFEAWRSRLSRKIFKRPGSFPVFSESRLLATASAVSASLRPEHELAFFKGVTPWGRWKPDRPYAAYTDVVFSTWFANTFDPGEFREEDLRRIVAAERAFLAGADAIFFESRWGLEEARRVHDLAGDHFHYAGRGSNLPIPDRDSWDGESPALVTMAKHFRQKGGDLVRKVYEEPKPEFPGLTWHILGGEPDFDWRSASGVRYEGFLDPGVPADLARMTAILGNAFLLVHPTREDTNPLVITEAATFGCPAVSVRQFAIPELIEDGETGVLLDPAFDTSALAETVRALLSDRDRYRAMRLRAREFALPQADWRKVGRRMADVITPLLSLQNPKRAI